MLSLSDLAVTMITGKAEADFRLRMRLRVSIPSMPGIITSRRTRSNAPFSIRSIAIRPPFEDAAIVADVVDDQKARLPLLLFIGRVGLIGRRKSLAEIGIRIGH